MEGQENNKEQQEIKIQVSSTDNIASRRSLIPSLFALVIVFFFFNFFTISCGGQKFGSVTGVNLVTGTEIKGPEMFPGQKSKGEEIPSSVWAIIALGAAIVGLCAFLIKEKREAVVGTGVGAIGVGSLLILQFVIKNELEKKSMSTPIQADFQFAYWGAFISFIIAGFISYLRLTKKHVIAESVSPHADHITTPITEISSQPQTIVSSTTQTKNFDTGKWVNTNKKLLAILFSVCIIICGGYYSFCLLSPKEVDIDKTNLRNGLRYEVNSDKPFSGIIYKLQENHLGDGKIVICQNVDKDYKLGYKYYFTFRDGKMDGKCKEYYSNGQLKKEGYMSDINPVGEWKQYYNNGQLSHFIPYKTGFIEGVVTTYYKNGTLWSKMLYKEGKLWESLVDNLPNGTPTGSNVKNGNGFTINQNEEGVSISKTTYENGNIIWKESYTPDSNKSIYTVLDTTAVDTAVVADTTLVDGY